MKLQPMSPADREAEHLRCDSLSRIIVREHSDLNPSGPFAIPCQACLRDGDKRCTILAWTEVDRGQRWESPASICGRVYEAITLKVPDTFGVQLWRGGGAGWRGTQSIATRSISMSDLAELAD